MDSERQKKILIMKIGVVSIIGLVFVLWVLNMRNVWRPMTVDNKDLTQNTDFSKFKQDVNGQMTEINQKLNDITNSRQAANNKAGEDLLNNIIKETNKISSTSIATSSSTSSPVLSASSTQNLPKVKNSNCPPYINCMPTVGASRPCQIPAGCEGITQIAY